MSPIWVTGLLQLCMSHCYSPNSRMPWATSLTHTALLEMLTLEMSDLENGWGAFLNVTFCCYFPLYNVPCGTFRHPLPHVIWALIRRTHDANIRNEDLVEELTKEWKEKVSCGISDEGYAANLLCGIYDAPDLWSCLPHVGECVMSVFCSITCMITALRLVFFSFAMVECGYGVQQCMK